MIKIKFGLKLWSTNLDLFNEARELIGKGIFHYIELTPIPNTKVTPFMGHNIPFVIHITTERHGANIADQKKREFNLKTINECIDWADKLDAKYLVLHPGFGSAESAKDFLKEIHDERLLIENMPKIGLNDENMIGYLPEQIEEMMNDKCSFCLDLNHAIKAAVSLKKPHKELVEEFMKLKPKMIHISDGRLDNEKDEHLNVGDGDYDIKFLVDCVKKSASEYLTLETPRTKNSLREDFENLRRIIANF